jgi:hypothetical protein
MSLSLPESAISIGVGVFVNCNNLKSLRIPGSITSIERNTFYACWNLTTLTIPSGVTSIGDGAFQNCSGLTRLTIPGKVASIGARAFDNCDSLTELELPQGVVSLGDYAFQNCDRLKTFTSFSLSPPLAGLSLFASCPALARIKVPSASLSAYKTAPGWSSYASSMVSTGVFSLEYNANFASGGSVPVDPNRYKEGDAVTVQGNTASLVRTDCSFGGWNTIPDGTGANYAAGDTVFVEAKDIVLYARWNRNSTWFHIVNSWGVGGGWEHVPDGKYWFTAEAMKNAQVYAFVLENIDDYEPRYVARFAISHPNRSQCLVGMSVGDPSAPVAQRRILPFSPFQGAGSLPLYAADTISVDVTEWVSLLATHDLYLSFRIGVTGTPGSLESFVLEEYSGYNSAPVRTLRAEATLPVSVTDASTTLNVRIPSSGILSDMSRSQERAGIVASRFPTRSFSSREVADMKSRIGVRSTSRNYNQIILGHGTGLAPPSEEEWGQIALQGKTIDTSGMTLSRSESPFAARSLSRCRLPADRKSGEPRIMRAFLPRLLRQELPGGARTRLGSLRFRLDRSLARLSREESRQDHESQIRVQPHQWRQGRRSLLYRNGLHYEQFRLRDLGEIPVRYGLSHMARYRILEGVATLQGKISGRELLLLDQHRRRHRNALRIGGRGDSRDAIGRREQIPIPDRRRRMGFVDLRESQHESREYAGRIQTMRGRPEPRDKSVLDSHHDG